MLKVSVAVFLFLPLVLTGCQLANLEVNNAPAKDLSTFGDSAASVDNLSKSEFYPTDEILVKAKRQFKERNFGRSYALYKKSVELFPKDPAAWLGFAASADHIGRYDTSDQSYRVLAQMIPNRIEFINNLGYSYLLRGDLKKARKYFLKAFEIDPTNEFTANNLELLRNSVDFAKRG